MSAGLPSLTLIIDRVSSGTPGNIYEQILGTVGTRNNNEAATNALIEYCLVQGYSTVVFKETDGAPFVDAIDDDEYNSGGKQVLTDVIARFTAASIAVGIQVSGQYLEAFKRIAEYNATCAAYEKISSVHVIDPWWKLSNPNTRYVTMRDNLLDAIDDGVGANQVDWTAAGGRLPIHVHVGYTYEAGAVAADGPLPYNQLVNLSAALATEYTSLGLNPLNPIAGFTVPPPPGTPWQPLIFVLFTEDDALFPTYESVRQNVWRLIDDTGLYVVFYDSTATPQTGTFNFAVSPETYVSNDTDAPDADKYCLGWFFEGRALSYATSDPPVIRNKKDPYDAFMYMTYDVQASVAACLASIDPFATIDPPIPRNDSVGLYFPITDISNRVVGDWRDSIASRLPLQLLSSNQSSTPYESIGQTGVYAYGMEKALLSQPAGITVNITLGQDVWAYLNVGGMVITSQYVMRKYTDSLPHGEIALDAIMYNAASTPQYLNKYNFSMELLLLGPTPYGGADSPFPLNRMQVPYGTNYFPLFSGGNYSAWFFNINDRLAQGSSSQYGFRLQQSALNYYTGAAYTNPNNIYTTFTSVGSSTHFTPYGPSARVALARYGKALSYHESIHGTQNFGIGFGITGQALQFTQGFNLEFLPEPVIVQASVVQNVACFGGSTGIATSTMLSGNDTRGPFTYQWYIGDPDSGGVAIPSGTNPSAITPTLTNVPAGEYWVVALAADTITSSKSAATITQPAEALAFLLESYQDICNGQPIGAVIGGVSGGTPGYTFVWTGPPGYAGSTDPVIFGLSIPGIYNVVVTDSNGCTTSFSQEILNIVTPAITLARFGDLTTCPGSSVGLSITSNYLFFDSVEWSTGATTPSISVTEAGTYSVIGRKGTCSSYAEITVPDPVPLAVSIVRILNLQCGSSKPGEIEVTGINGCPGYTYLWTWPDASTNTNQNQYGLTLPGTYNVEITDSQGATASLDIEMLEQTFSLLMSGPEIICAGDTDIITVEPQAGGTAPFTYVMNAHPPGATIVNNGLYATVQNASAGVYGFIVTDANGCVATQGYNVPSTPPIIVTATGTDADFEQNNGTATVASVTGGSGTYTNYAWTGPNGYSQSGAALTTVNNLAPGIYKITVTDDVDCTGYAYVTIREGLSVAQNDLASLQCCLGKLWKKTFDAERIGDKNVYNCLYAKAKRLTRLIRVLQAQQTFVPEDYIIDTDPARQPLATPTECLTDEEKAHIYSLAREICNDCACNC